MEPEKERLQLGIHGPSCGVYILGSLLLPLTCPQHKI